MYRMEDPKNEISSYEWESDLGRLICGNLVYLSEIVENVSDEYLDFKLSLCEKENNNFKLFESFYEPLIYYMYKNNIYPRIERCLRGRKTNHYDFSNCMITSNVKGSQNDKTSIDYKGSRCGNDGYQGNTGNENKDFGVKLEEEKNFNNYNENYDVDEEDEEDEDEEKDKYLFSYRVFMKSSNKALNDLFRFGKTPEININELFDFVLSLLYIGGFNISSFVMAIINMDNLIKKSNILICQHNWRPIFVISLIISDKLWDDNCVKSGDLSGIVGFISPRMIKYLELVFSVSSNWNFEFDLENIKKHISKILKKELNKKLMDKVISSGFYQSYCYEDLCETNTKTKIYDYKEEFENKESEIAISANRGFNASKTLMSSDLKKEFVANIDIGNHSYTQNQRTTPFNIRNTNQSEIVSSQNSSINNISLSSDNRMGMVQPQLPSRSLSFYRNAGIHPKIRNPISINTNNGVNVYNPNSMINIARNNKAINHNSNVAMYNFMRNSGSNPQLNSKQNVHNVINSNNKRLIDSNMQLPSKPVLFNNVNLNSNSTNQIIRGIYPRSMTPDNHILKKNGSKQGTRSPVLSPTNIERGRDNNNTIRMSSNPHSLFERRPSYSTLSHQQEKFESNGKGALGGGFLSSRNLNSIKRSSSENRGFNSNKIDIGNTFQPTLRRDGLFSYARNTVSSALTSITRTFGFSSNNRLNVNTTKNGGNLSNGNDADQENNKRVVQQTNQIRNVSVPPQINNHNIGDSAINPIQTNRNRSNDVLNLEKIPFNGINEMNNLLSRRSSSTERTLHFKRNGVGLNSMSNSQNISALNNNTKKTLVDADKSIFSNIWNTVTGKNMTSNNFVNNGGQVRSLSVGRPGGVSLQRPYRQLGLRTNNPSSIVTPQTSIPLSSRSDFPSLDPKTQMLNSTRVGMSGNASNINFAGLSNNRWGNFSYNNGNEKTVQRRSSSISTENRPSFVLNGAKESSLFSMSKIINPISNLLRSKDSSLSLSTNGSSIGENNNGFSINSLINAKLLR
ncbi:ppg3 [Cryptosporidium bovis]|uniref:ppg3 n=1 Tax=Cryptosporidium bovis TaxID=310047 RepID=UPI00351A2B65|nr:ppg3 [Cryptosporidium bovis]